MSKIGARFAAVASGLALAVVLGPALGGAVQVASFGGTGTLVADEDHGDRDRDRDRGRGDEAQVISIDGTQMLVADEDHGDRDRDRGNEGHDREHAA